MNARAGRSWIGQLRLDWDHRRDLATNPDYDKQGGIYIPQTVSTTCGCDQAHHAEPTNWSGINQPITLTYRKGTEELGNVLLRGFQVADMLKSLGCPVPIRVQALENLYRAKPRNQIVIVLKTAVRLKSEPILRSFKRWGNTVLFDVVDGLIPASLASLPDAYICSSITEQIARDAQGAKTILSLQSPDQIVPTLPFEERPFTVVYHGDERNAQHLPQLPKLVVLKSPMTGSPQRIKDFLHNTLPLLSHASHHYSVRKWNELDGFKPMMKGFFAAYLGSVVIASAEDEESRLILGDDYPYLARTSSLEDVREVIDHAQHTHLGPEWQHAVSTMRELRHMSCTVKTAQDLVAGLRRLAS